MAGDSSQLQRWIETLIDLRFRRTRALAGWRAGARQAVNLVRIAGRAPELSTPEPFEAAREQLQSASEADRPSWRIVALAFARAHAQAQTAPVETQLLAQIPIARVSVELEQLSLPDALCELPVCRDRVRRTQLARSVNEVLRELEPLQAERAEREISDRRRLGADALAEPTAELARDAEQILRETSDAADDLLEFRFRRAGLDGNGGARHDFELALELLDLRENLSPHLAPELAAQLARGLEMDPRAGGTITVDAEPRESRVPGLQVAQLGRRELVVVSAPLGSPADLERLARGLGTSLHLANISDELDDVDRFLADPALAGASGWILARPISDPAWIRRTLRVPSRPAGELAQAFAVRALLGLRIAAARFLSAIDLESQGPSAQMADQFRSQMSAACRVDAGGQGAFELEVHEASAELRALLLAERLSMSLVENFDQDWWRNPRSQELLRSFSSPGGSVAIDALAGARPLKVLVQSFIERAAR